MSKPDASLENPLARTGVWSPLREFGYRRLTHRNFRRWEECQTLVAWLDPQPGERILDIGCGDGWWDRRIAKSGCNIVGIDIDEKRLARAAQRNAHECIQYQFMNAEKLEFEDASFNKAVSMCVVEHFNDDNAVLREVSRVLEPGAPFILSADSLANPEVTDVERDVHRRRYAVNTFYTVATLEEKLDAAGFELEHTHYILTTRLSLAMARLSWRADDWSEARGKPIRSVLGEGVLIGINTLGKLAADVSERLWRRRDSGLTLLARARKRR